MIALSVILRPAERPSLVFVADARTYRVRNGDTLFGIARTYCGNGLDWPALYAASHLGKDPDMIYLGQEVTLDCKIPQKLRKTLPDPVARTAPDPVLPVSAGPSYYSALGSQGFTLDEAQNFLTVARFLITHGYTRTAAAGIAGCIAGESAGNPESTGSGGGGLIGFTPLPAGYVTGDITRDLYFQVDAILAYNKGWSQYIPLLNSAATPGQAADIYSQYFERPAVLYSDVRPAVANAIFAVI